MVIALASFPLFALGSARSRGLRLSASTPLVELAPRGSTAHRSPILFRPNKKPSGPAPNDVGKGTEGDFRGTTPLENDSNMSGGAGGIRTRDPHTASVMRSHCATAPIALRSSTRLTGVTPARATASSPSRLPGEFRVPLDRLAPPPALLLRDYAYCSRSRPL